jgi:hypothetical protein
MIGRDVIYIDIHIYIYSVHGRDAVDDLPAGSLEGRGPPAFGAARNGP